MSEVAAACDPPPLLRLPPPPTTGEPPPALFELYAAPAPPLERPALELNGESLSASSPRPSVSS